MTFNIDLSEFLDFAESMGVAADALDDELGATAFKVAQEGARIAQGILASNGSVVTGDLYDSIQAQGGGMSGGVASASYGPTDDEPARWVEFGRGPVYARPGGALKFQIKGRGPYLYRKSVGPAPARPFMRPSVARLRPLATKMFGEAVMRAISKAR